nr:MULTISPECIES: flagellar basal body P-ring protein FlgI [Buttiauxella]
MLICWLVLWPAFVQSKATPLLNLVEIGGERKNQLVGYGLVVGLDGSGDRNQVTFTAQSMSNMLRQFGIQEENQAKTKNVAAVSIHAEISNVTSPGQIIDITVSSVGDAKSLRGGTLLLAPLYGVDGEVYAFAQGNLVVGGASAEGSDGSSVTVNVPTVGRIPGGAVVEKAVPSQPANNGYVNLNLKTPSFNLSRNIEQAITARFGAGVASAYSAGSVRVRAPSDPSQRVNFIAMLEEVKIQEGRVRPRIVLNSRTGTVVMSDTVYVRKAAVTHGNLTVAITENTQISQPNALAEGTTEKVRRSTVNMSEAKPRITVMPEGTSLDKIVKSLNELGATPSDLMSILQALDEAGALDADLIVI